MAKKVCFISYDGMTDPLGQSQVLPYLKNLVAKGHTIHLISFEKPERFEKFKADIDKICKEANIVWHPKLYTKKPPILSTVKDIRVMTKTLTELHKIHPFDILHARSYISMMAAFPFRNKGLKVLFDMRGFWADERIDGAIWNLKIPVFKWVYNFFKKKEKLWLENSDAIVSLTYAAADYIRLNFKISDTIQVIPCCTDEMVFKPSGNPINQSDDLVYVGSLGTWYLLDEMLEFFSIWKEFYPRSKFRFITLENKDFVLKSASKFGLKAEDFEIAPAQRHEVASRIEGAAAGIFFLKKSFSKMASSPVKQGEIMTMGLPIFCNTGVGDSSMIIKKYHSGILIDEYTKNGYKLAIESYRQERFISDEIKAGAYEYFSLSQGVEKYHRLYESL